MPKISMRHATTKTREFPNEKSVDQSRRYLNRRLPGKTLLDLILEHYEQLGELTRLAHDD
jgi:hypothetical protein